MLTLAAKRHFAIFRHARRREIRVALQSFAQHATRLLWPSYVQQSERRIRPHEQQGRASSQRVDRQADCLLVVPPLNA